MRLQTSQGLLTFPASRGETVEICCAAALRLEEQGEYEAAAAALGRFWPVLGEPPNTAGLSGEAAARLLVRAGSLTAELGSQRQEGWQEKAKDLLTKASTLAGENTDLWLEAQKYLGTCYWREGALSEARVITESAIARSRPDTQTGLRLRLNLALIEWSAKRNDRALEILRRTAGAVEEYGSALTKALFHNGLALNHKAKGDTDAAIIEMTACCYHLEEAGHRPYLIAAEINLANLMVQAKAVADAHRHLDRAEDLARELQDAIHLAHAKDSRARAFIAARNYEAAELAARKAVSIINESESGVLVDFLCTLARAQVGMRQQSEALKTYLRAYALARERVGADRSAHVALELFGEMAGEVCLEAHVPFEEVNHKMQESIFRAALESADGKVTEAAMRLGMTQANLSWHLNNRYGHLRIKEKRQKSLKSRPLAAKPPKN